MLVKSDPEKEHQIIKQLIAEDTVLKKQHELFEAEMSLSSKEYNSLQEKLEDDELIQMVLERGPVNPEKAIPQKDIWKKYGITDTDLEGWENIEFQ